jgi:hypothetical protein
MLMQQLTMACFFQKVKNCILIIGVSSPEDGEKVAPKNVRAV